MLIMNIMEMMNAGGSTSKGEASSSQNTSNATSFAQRLDNAVAGSVTFKDTQNRVDNKTENKKTEETVKNSEINDTEESDEEKSEENQYIPFVLIPIQTEVQQPELKTEVVSVTEGADAVVKIGNNDEQIISAQNVEISQDVEITFEVPKAQNEFGVQNTEMTAEEQPKFTMLDTSVLKDTSDLNTDQIENDMPVIPERRPEGISAAETENKAAEILNLFESSANETVELPENDFVNQILDEASTQLKNDSVAEGYKALETARPVIQNEQPNKQSGGDTNDNTDQAAQQPKMSMPEQSINTQIGAVNNFEARLDSAVQASGNSSPAQNVRFQILEQVSSMISDNKQELTLQLKPYHLGGLTITLVQDQNGVTAKLVTASRDAHALIQSEMATMQEVLRDKGIHVVEMEVIYDQMANSTGKGESDTGYNPQSSGNMQQRGGSQGGLNLNTEEVSWMYEEMTGIEVLAEQGGSVEFSA